MSTEKLPNILIIDDDTEICNVLLLSVQEFSNHVKFAHDGKTAMSLLPTFLPDIVILDIGLPDFDGFSLCSWIRKEREHSQPIIVIISARNSDDDKLYGYDFGADEYISKPFSPKFLLGRIKNLWQKNRKDEKKETEEKTSDDSVLSYHGVQMDVEEKRIWVGKKEIYLTPTEWHILMLLLREPGKVFSRAVLLEKIRGNSYKGYERAIDVHLSSLRKKLDTQGHLVKTKHGMGYYLRKQVND